MNHDSLVLFQKIYDLLLEIYQLVNKFPKNQRFVLGQRMETTLMNILEIIINVNLGKVASGYFKKMDIELSKLKIFVRLSKDLRFISIKKYGKLEEEIIEIGKLIGGWKKTLI